MVSFWVGESSWRLMLGIQAVPSLLFLILLGFVPETPRWLVLKKNKIDEARNVLKIINPDDYETVLETIIKNNKEEHTSAIG